MSCSDDAGTSFLSRHKEAEEPCTAFVMKLMRDPVTTNENIMRSLIESLQLARNEANCQTKKCYCQKFYLIIHMKS